MRRVLALFFLLLASLSGSALSQPIPHVVRVLLRPHAAIALRGSFAEIRKNEPDIQQIELAGDSLPAILGLPRLLHINSVKPCLPEHSIVFEDIREHLNPSLFQPHGGLVSDQRVDPLLRKSEDRLSRWFILRYSDDIAPELAARSCLKSPQVEWAEPISPAVPQFTPNDSLLGQQYALSMMNAFQAWDVVRADTSIIIADVDEGVQFSHPDLSAAFWHNQNEMGLDGAGHNKLNNHIDDDSDGFVDDWQGWDFAGTDDMHPDNTPTATASHGVHTSGIAAATGNNREGIAGVAFGARIMAIKTSADNDPLDKIYYGYPGVVFAADHGAQVINCSFAESYRSAADEDVIDYAYSKGSVVVASCGNAQGFAYYYPAAYEHAFSVSMVDENRQIANAPESPTRNTHVDVAAPGKDILSTVLQSDYGQMSGTSMAAPQVSGAAALVIQSSRKGPLAAKYPNMTAGQVMAQLRATTSGIANDQYPGLNGKGIVDIYAAVTDTSARALRVESASVNTPDGIPHAGDQANVSIQLKNYLAPFQDARANVQFLDSNGVAYDATSTGVIRSSVTSLDLGAFATMEERTIDGSAFPISVNPSATAGSKVYVKLQIFERTAGQAEMDYSYFELVVAPSFRTLDTNHVTVSLYNNGAIGHVRPGEADGMSWTSAPPSIDIANRDLLWTGTFLIGSAASHVADANGMLGAPDLFPLASNPIRSFASRLGKEVTTAFTYNDAASGENIDVYERAVEFVTRQTQDGVVLDFNLKARPAPPTDLPMSAGLYFDWDLGSGGFNNTLNFDATDSIFFLHRLDPRYPVVAVKLMSKQAFGSDLNYYAENADTEFVSTMADEWRLLTNVRPATGYCDAAMTLGARSITFGPGDTSMHLTYAIGLGLSLDSARASVNALIKAWNGRDGVKSAPAVGDAITVWPNPAGDAVTISLAAAPTGAPIRVRLLDVLGRTVVQDAIVNGNSIDVRGLSSGLYWLEVTAGNERSVARFIKE